MPKGAKYGGRTKGTPNKKTVIFSELLEKKGLDVVEELKKSIASRDVEMVRALTDILPYIAPKLKEQETNNTPLESDEMDSASTAQLLEMVHG